jgi:alpha-ribazole phosphatase
MTKTLYFIRHGESVSNAGGITMEHKAIPLTERGQLQANIVAESLELKPSVVLVSEHIRTQQTAQPFYDKHACETRIQPLLNEISCLSDELIVDMTSKERRPLADAYWNNADIHQRLGVSADTFIEFKRVETFKDVMDHLPHHAVIFGHGIWFGLLAWKLLGFEVTDSMTMKAFRRFQTGLPLANGIGYRLSGDNSNNLEY